MRIPLLQHREYSMGGNIPDRSAYGYNSIRAAEMEEEVVVKTSAEKHWFFSFQPLAVPYKLTALTY